MTEQEIQDLALKLAREAIVKTHDSSFYVSPNVIEMVRAAVAHGILQERDRCIKAADETRLRLCERYQENLDAGISEMNGNMDWGRVCGAVRVLQALRAKADKIEAAK